MTSRPTTVTAAVDASNYTAGTEELHFLIADNVQQTSRFRTITWPALLALARKPVCLPKIEAPCFCPHAAPSKRRQDILDHDQFGMLVTDIDHGDLELDDIVEYLSALGIEQYLIYSTASHRIADGLPRWRVCVPLADTVPTEQWSDLQEYLNRVFNADECTARVTQVAFCPNSISGHYEYVESTGPALDANDTSVRLVAAAIDCAEQRHQQELNRAGALPKERKQIDVPTGSINVIAAVNDAHDMVNLLHSYGYRKVGRRWVHPDSNSGLAGVILVSGRYVSYHACDPLADGKSHDCFDLIQQHEHGGDFLRALRAGGDLLTEDGITIQKHNQIQYLKAQS